MKIKQEAGFIYEDSVRFLINSGNQHNSISGLQESSEEVFNYTNGKETPDSLEWSDIYNIPVSNNNTKFILDESDKSAGGSRSQSPRRQLIQSDEFVDSEADSWAEQRHNSSTRCDFLELKEPFLSVSSAVYTDTSDVHSVMSELDDACACGSRKVASECCEAGGGGATGGLENAMKAMVDAVSKIDGLANAVEELQIQVKRQNKVISNLKSRDDKDDSSSSEAPSISKKPKTSSSKVDRIKEEKERQLKLLKESLKDKEKENSESEAGSASDDSLSLNLNVLKNKLSRKKKTKCKKREKDLLEEVGATFPDQEFTSASSSGTDETDNSKFVYRRKKKVKSGASIKKRPVVKTELWPHTIANEEEGEEVACDNIGLSRFFSCFTHIMLNCRRSESAGRAVLLHAVSVIIEALYWAEARTFHNLMMVKIEQGRLSWADDFAALAESFIDKKIRNSFKSRGAAGYSSAGKAGGYNRGYSAFNKKGSYNNNSYNNNSYNNNSRNSGRNKPVYNSVCKQWNFGNCSYGDRCNRWHICWSCAEAGKVGEAHKASSHERASVRPRQPEPPRQSEPRS